MLDIILTWITFSFTFGAVIMFGATGETLSQKAGNMNLGTPGIMCIGGAFGFAGSFIYENAAGNNASSFVTVLIALVCAFVFSSLAGLLFVFITTTMRANQNVAGLTLTIFGSGLAKFVGTFIIPKGEVAIKASEATTAFSKKIDLFTGSSSIEKIIKTIFFNYGFMFYVSIILAILVHFFLYRTKLGLNLRAIGESPATADAAGINVTKYKYLSTIIGCGISGLGGLYYVLDYSCGTWSTGAAVGIEALGWLSVALVIFATWKPLNLIWGSAIFGLCYWIYNYIAVFGVITTNAQSALLQSIPYIITIIVLLISSFKKSKETQPPQALGLPYFREDR